MTAGESADIAWRIFKTALAKTAERQRWAWRHVAQRVAIIVALIAIAWLSGSLDEVDEKRQFALLVFGAAVVVFILDLIVQLFIATYEAGTGARGKTEELKRLYRLGRRYDATVPGDVIKRWEEDVAKELGRVIPSERFAFETVSDEVPPNPLQRLDRLILKLRKLRLILSRADRADPGEG